jgi:uncharacterized UBP type Zn finger protein
MSDTSCTHLDRVADVEPTGLGCAECLTVGSSWIHLRVCMSCGKVGCCDSSPNRHATAHHADVGHPIIQSYEPGENWWWCYDDELAFTVADGPDFSYR